MTYACKAWDFAADICLIKLLRQEIKVTRNAGTFLRDTPIRIMRSAFQIQYV
jgi:hypothetical protein